MEMRGPYSSRKRVAIDFPENSGKTVQYFKEECDVNNIIAKHGTNGGPVWMNREQPKYIDCTSIPDYQTAQNTVIRAHEGFMALPAKIRAQFDNDPHKFVIFATNPENLDALRQMGLAPPAADPKMPVDTTASIPTEPSDGTE